MNESRDERLSSLRSEALQAFTVACALRYIDLTPDIVRRLIEDDFPRVVETAASGQERADQIRHVVAQRLSDDLEDLAPQEYLEALALSLVADAADAILSKNPLALANSAAEGAIQLAAELDASGVDRVSTRILDAEAAAEEGLVERWERKQQEASIELLRNPSGVGHAARIAVDARARRPSVTSG